MTEAEPERLASSLGDGRWLLLGDTGSGKTAALLARARHLRALHPEWRILLLCFNGALAARLDEIAPAAARIEISAFHDWAQRQLDAAGVVVPPPPGRGTLWDQYWTRDVARLLLGAFEDGRIPSALYQAVLIDEGQDFVEDWYRALLQALDPATDSLLIALDPAQNIYKRAVAWPRIGVDPDARVVLLTVNRRNTRPILNAARSLIRTLDADEAAARRLRDAAGGSAIATEALPDGPTPEARRSASFGQSRDHALGWIRSRLTGGVPAADVLVLGLSRLDMITVNAWLRSKHVGAWLPAEAGAAAGVRVSTIHGAKGLDADSVLVLDAHQLASRDDEEARRLLYIAMTRARRDLCVTYFRDTALMAELARATEASKTRGV